MKHYAARLETIANHCGLTLAQMEHELDQLRLGVANQHTHWLWTGPIRRPKLRLRFGKYPAMEKGFPVTNFNGKRVRVARWLWELVFNQSLDGIDVVQFCGHHPCVYPPHHRLRARLNPKTEERPIIPALYYQMLEDHPWMAKS